MGLVQLLAILIKLPLEKESLTDVLIFSFCLFIDIFDW